MRPGFAPRRLRSHPAFFAAMAVLILATVAVAAELLRQVACCRVARRERERLRLEQLAPQARPEMAAASGVELERERARLQLVRAAWPGAEAAETAMDRIGAYAELDAYAERCREAAARAGTAVAKGERFGFARHASEAPAESEVGLVLAQRRELERVLLALFEAGPQRLIGVWRENPATDSSARTVNEWCALPMVRSVRVPELVRTRCVRVAFVGTTACLRRFLNRLAGAPALVVREVAVSAPETKTERSAAAKGLVPGRRQFTVVLESVAVVSGTGGAANATAGAAAVWREPQEAEGGGRSFEVFAPAKLDYDEVRKRWRSAADAATAADDFGIELVAVRRVPCPWRLVGYVGEGGGAAALLEENATRRSVLLHVGESEAASGVALAALAIEREPSGGYGARATLNDPDVREPVVLTTAGDGRPDRLVAVLRVDGRTEPVEAGVGTIVQGGGASYTVSRISTGPDEVEVTRAATPERAAAVRRLPVAKK